MVFTDEQKKLIDSDYKNVQIIISFPNNEATEIHNDRIYQESMYYEESLIDQDDFCFGKCNSSIFKIKVANFNGYIDGSKMNVEISIRNDTKEIKISLGKFIVSSSEKTSDRRYRNIIATDYMTLLDIDVSNWFNTVLFNKDIKSRTIEESIDMFCKYIGVEHEETNNLINKDFVIKNPGNVNYLIGRSFLENLCEINAVFGHFDENGVLTFVNLQRTSLYPADTLFPKKYLFPSGAKDKDINRFSNYIKCDYKDYNIKTINSLKITNQEDDVGIIVNYPDTNKNEINQYKIVGNILLYNLDTDVLTELANKLLVAMRGLEYRPNETIVSGGLYLKLGGIVKISSRYYLEDEVIDNYFESITLKRVISGIQAITTTVSANGNEYQSELVDINTQVQLQKNKLSRIEKNVDGITTEFTNFESNTNSKFEQTSEIISTKVSKGDVSTEISQESDKVIIKGNRLEVYSDNFNLDGNGNTTISGDITCLSELRMSIYGNKHAIIKGNAGTEENALEFRGIDDEMFLKYLGKYSGGEEPETIFVLKNMECLKNFACSGTKNRVIDTDNYNKRLQYCYETASPMFGDIGHGIIGEDGYCYIDIDNIFLETVDLKHEYYVFLQSYGAENLYIFKKTNSYFIVKGTPNTEFDWEVKAKQKDYTFDRLEEMTNDKFADFNYEKSAIQYLNNYEKEINYD